MFAGNDNNPPAASGPGSFADVQAADADLDRLLSGQQRQRQRATPGAPHSWMHRLALSAAGLGIIGLMATASLWILAENKTDETMAVIADHARMAPDEEQAGARVAAGAGEGAEYAPQAAPEVVTEFVTEAAPEPVPQVAAEVAPKVAAPPEPVPPLVMLPVKGARPAVADAPGKADDTGGDRGDDAGGNAGDNNRAAARAADALAQPAAPRATTKSARARSAGAKQARRGASGKLKPAGERRARAAVGKTAVAKTTIVRTPIAKTAIVAPRGARVNATLKQVQSAGSAKARRCRSKTDPACRPAAKARTAKEPARR